MVEPLDVQQLPLSFVQHRCAQESECFAKKQPHNPHYCYELFRRALEECNERAWEFIYHQYRRMVIGWIQQDRYFPQVSEEIDVLVNNAFYNMWHAFTKKSPYDASQRVHNHEKFANFTELSKLLKFLKMCTHSAVREAVSPDIPLPETVDIATNDPGLRAEKLDRELLWRIFDQCLQNKKEFLTLYSRFELDMKPREIYEQHPDMFKDISDVYRTLENTKDRLLRCSRVKDFFKEP